MVDLGGKTLLPGFLDAHSHYISSLTVANQVNVYAPPAGPGKDPASIVAELVKFRDAKKIPNGEVIQAYGYDENVMPNGSLLNRDDLDKAFPDNPVLVGHVSMHGAVLNSAALKKWSISAATKTPPGGVIVRKPGTNEPYGLIMETAYLPVFASLPKPTREQEVEWTRAGQMLYAQAGVTTAHDGATHADELEIMKRATDAGANIIDVIAYPFITDLDKVLATHPVSGWGKYDRHFKIGGVKITIDGSPQGKTAFFTKPYLTGGPGGEKNWRGELTVPQEVVNQTVKRVYDLGVPLNLHANGDAAIDVFLDGTRVRGGRRPAEGPARHADPRPVHAQGPARQVRASTRSRRRSTRCTPTTSPRPTSPTAAGSRRCTSARCATRSTRGCGRRTTPTSWSLRSTRCSCCGPRSTASRARRAVIGTDQRVTPLEALKAMTINVALQYGEQDSKGSLEAGKLADMVILERQPAQGRPDGDQGHPGAGDVQGRQDGLHAEVAARPALTVATVRA